MSQSLQDAIKVFIESFPLKNFWEHVIIVNTWANPNDESFQDYYMNERQYFLDKINRCHNLKDYMITKNIDIPKKIKEYFVDTKQYQKNEEIKDIFTQIQKDILKKN